MGKKKDHLWRAEDLVRSVMRGEEVKSLCGFAATMTRERLEEIDYHATCADCVREAAAQLPGEEIGVSKKAGWTALLERVWRDEHPVVTQPQYTFTINYVGTWNNGGTKSQPPAA